ncbi:hypothetical protein RJ641_032019 [Dillenia turbinata]|uniref:Uncharacterized protein n=1 Tax=Dillenia turbinata TaxID=194707 RepID=A0AAN8VYP5_9MAGN
MLIQSTSPLKHHLCHVHLSSSSSLPTLNKHLLKSSNLRRCNLGLGIHVKNKLIKGGICELRPHGIAFQEDVEKDNKNRTLDLGTEDFLGDILVQDGTKLKSPLIWGASLSCGVTSWMIFTQVASSAEETKVNAMYEVGELFELGIQLSYLLLLLGLLGVGTFFVIRQVLVRRELDLSAKELQEQVRSGDASATEYFELGAVMLRRKFYPAATKYLLQAIEKWDGDDQDLAQVYNALGVSYVRDGKLEKGISQFETAVKLQPGYVTAWNNLGDAYEKKKELKSALKAFEEVLLFDPNNKIARPRRDALKDRVTMYEGVPVKTKER